MDLRDASDGLTLRQVSILYVLTPPDVCIVNKMGGAMSVIQQRLKKGTDALMAAYLTASARTQDVIPVWTGSIKKSWARG
jgi:hypothetical protein